MGALCRQLVPIRSMGLAQRWLSFSQVPCPAICCPPWWVGWLRRFGVPRDPSGFLWFHSGALLARRWLSQFQSPSRCFGKWLVTSWVSSRPRCLGLLAEGPDPVGVWCRRDLSFWVGSCSRLFAFDFGFVVTCCRSFGSRAGPRGRSLASSPGAPRVGTPLLRSLFCRVLHERFEDAPWV